MKLPNFMHPTQKFCFSFSKLTYGHIHFNPENFANIWQIKWNEIRSMKFEEVRIHLQCKWRFSLLSSQNFATMAMWCNSFSSLLKARQSSSKVTKNKHPQINASPCQKKQLLLKDCEKNIKYHSIQFPINSVSAKK